MKDYGEEAIDAIVWCIRHNALVRFHSDKTVEVTMNGKRRRRNTIVEAIAAHGVPL